MKKILVHALVLVYGLASAQPDGRLYFYTGPSFIPTPYFGYIQFPKEKFSVIDSVQLTDIAIGNERIYAAGLKDVVVYDTSGLHPVDTLEDVYPSHLAANAGQLAITSDVAPYVRLYDEQTLNLIFSIDTPKIAEPPTDVAIWGNKIFVLLSTGLLIVDITLQDTLATIPIPSPFPFPGYNWHLVEMKDDFYIAIGYATGAPRSALMSFDKLTYEVDTAFYYLGNEFYYPPVATDDKIYLFSFDSYYDITEDSLHISSSAGSKVVAYDPVSGVLFLEHGQGSGINYFLNGIFSDTIPLAGPTIEKALFAPTASVINLTLNFRPEPYRLSIYPNPVTGLLRIVLPDCSHMTEVDIFDMTGDLVESRFVEAGEEILELNTGSLQPGCYFVKVISGDKIYVTRLVKHDD